MSLLPSFGFPHSHPFILVLSPLQGLSPVLPPLPKRPALEKANGATTMFNAGMFQYQQALANMQFQQQAAFIPSGKAYWAIFNPMFVAIAIGIRLFFSISSEWLNDCVISLLATRLHVLAHVCKAWVCCVRVVCFVKDIMTVIFCMYMCLVYQISKFELC